ncbi:hypothetical protein [Fluviicola chungangensis]|uniref:Cytochrome B n=1 Tax=Fluviicola chungangensis TaxID=2597671 RepID=A0A556N728_9FLAO|nr:hypothetical protein [Fluviicola chungangensis]TSJ47930.1 hypothetical protein FO442_02015 [Fluviicola chungangensis]
MYSTLIFLHSLTRWLVVISLIYAVYRGYTGLKFRKPFSKTDNAVRHWTATITHVQLIIGILVYVQSPAVKYFWKHTGEALRNWDVTFYSLVHALIMLLAIVIVTIGSAKAKRMESDSAKFKTMLLWFLLAFLLIFSAIPWPFSPFSNRPYFR